MFAPVSVILALIGPFAGDLTNALPIALRVAFYTAPITFPLSVIPESVRPYLWLNPLTSLVELLRDTLIFGGSPASIPFAIMWALVLVLTAIAVWSYRRAAAAVHDVV
jgi:lipopolysaccharide transport system permease protein